MKYFAFIVLFFIVELVFAQSFYKAPVAVTATVTSTKILDQNNLRRYLLIQNTGSVSVIVKFGSVQSGTEGIVIPAGGNYEPSNVPMSSIYLRSSSSTAAVTFVEGQ